MTVCEKHRKKPAKGYSPCPGCEVERLQQRLASAEKDAARYRWLRDQPMYPTWKLVAAASGEQRDAAIDAEIADAMPANTEVKGG